MHSSIAAGGAALALLAPHSIPPGSASLVVAQAYAQNLAMNGYTFKMNVALRMHHFPWLRFHMQGDGRFVRGGDYTVQFTRAPWFASKQKRLDLSLLAPETWPQKYTFTPIAERGDATTFALHAIDDPTLKQAMVTVAPTLGTTRVVASYTDGTTITMHVRCRQTDGYLLPDHIDADIAYPAMPLSASASFTDYAFAQ